jgi:hypothetical protein
MQFWDEKWIILTVRGASARKEVKSCVSEWVVGLGLSLGLSHNSGS